MSTATYALNEPDSLATPRAKCGGTVFVGERRGARALELLSNKAIEEGEKGLCGRTHRPVK